MKNGVLVFFSLCAAIVFAELLVRLFVPVRDVGALFTVVDPVMGKRIKKNFHTVRVTPEFTMTFTSNSLGFRGPEPVSPPADPVLFIGDSFTMGFGVSDGEEFPARIKAMLDAKFGKDAVAVVNAGMGDNGTGRWIKLLKAEVDGFKPRLVVLQVMENDFDDNVKEAYFSVSDDGTLNESPVRIGRMKALEPFLDAVPGLSGSYLYSLIRQAVAGYTATARLKPASPGNAAPKAAALAANPPYADRLTERLVAEAVSVCQAKGYPVFALLVGLEGGRLSRIEGIFRAHSIPVLVAPRKAERPDLYYKIDGHWNAAGHAFVAGAVFEQLQSRKLIPGR